MLSSFLNAMLTVFKTTSPCENVPIWLRLNTLQLCSVRYKKKMFYTELCNLKFHLFKMKLNIGGNKITKVNYVQYVKQT